MTSIKQKDKSHFIGKELEFTCKIRITSYPNQRVYLCPELPDFKTHNLNQCTALPPNMLFYFPLAEELLLYRCKQSKLKNIIM